MKKILIITPYSRDANSFWRCIGPMSYFSRHSNGRISCEYMEQKSMAWDNFAFFDAVFMHRPCRADDLTILRIAKNSNIPVWIDYDDWLFDLPDWNPHQTSYHNPNLQQIMSHMIACADIVSVTTEALAKKFAQVNPNVVIVPNAYRSDLFPFRAKEMPERKTQFLWRGTNTHDGDLLSVSSELAKLPDKLIVFGSLPYAIRKEMDSSQYDFMPHQDVLLYWKKIYELAPKFMINPLYDCFFNRCKSNIAWMESLHAGALTIAPDLPEWKNPGAITYKANDAASFKEAIDIAMTLSLEDYQNQVKIGFEFMKSKYDITVVNQIREKIFFLITGKDFKKNTQSPYDQTLAMMAMSVLKRNDKQL